MTTVAARYQMNDLIGQGGMGSVFRGIDTHTQEAVAVKALKPELVASDPEMLLRFAREGEALRQLNHPNIVKMLGTAQEDGQHYLIMEYVSGGSLFDLLQSPLPFNRALGIALELADALARAHHLKIIHRDIKPANVLIAEDGTPRLTDFGVAQMSSEKRITQTGAAVGTLDYLSPEALNGEMVDVRSDIWAFGVMLFEMVAGQRPFESDNITGVITAILTKPVPDLETLRPDAPVALVDLIYRMLEKGREARIPSVRLVGAELEAILQGRETPLPSPLPASPRAGAFDTPTPSTDAPKHNLPAQTTPFVGRELELEELKRLLGDSKGRLVTILASGGMGKTRLALEVARQLVSTQFAAPLHSTSFTSGAFFVSLAPLTSATTIVSAIAEAVGFQFYQAGEPKQQLLDYFREKSLLMVLDNFEHVLEGAPLVSELLSYAPDVKVLATSRERLNLSGETLFTLRGLDFPDLKSREDAFNYSAVRLFMQSAKRARPNFQLTADDLEYVTRICRMVDGIPLGIVLAAAWVEMLSLKEITDEIIQGLDFLQTEMRDIPERHRSIRAVFDYSWNLLSEDERAIFAKLSVFRGGFTREAVQAVAGVSLKTLAALVNKSLLRRDPITGRYEVHELLRQYGEGHLKASGDLDTTRDAHSAYYANFMRQRELDIKGRRQLAALNEIEVEFDNVVTAWNWSVSQKDYPTLDQAQETLWLFYYMCSRYREGEELFRQAQTQLAPTANEEPHPAWGRIMARRWAQLYWSTSRSWGANKEEIEQALQIARSHDDQHELAFCVLMLGYIAMEAEDFGEALKYFEESLSLFQRLGDKFYEVQSLHRIGQAHSESGTMNDFFTITKQSLKVAREIGHKVELAHNLFNLGNAEIYHGHYDEGESLCQEAVTISREMTSQFSLGHSLSLLGIAKLVNGNFEQAQASAEEGLAVAANIQDSLTQTYAMAVLLVLAGIEEEDSRINELSAKIKPLRSNAAGYLLRDWGLSIASCILGNYQAAWLPLLAALRQALIYHAGGCMMWCLAVSAILLAHEREKERAVELLALAFTHPLSAKGLLEKWALLSRVRAQLQADLPLEAYNAAWERGKARDLEATVKDLLAELR